jgi:hypothetical protein
MKKMEELHIYLLNILPTISSISVTEDESSGPVTGAGTIPMGRT